MFSEIEVDGFKMLLEGFESSANETPFLVVSVKEYLWGYTSLLASLDQYQKCLDEQEDSWVDSWDDPCEKLLEEDNLALMGLFYGRNGTSLDIRKINTGIKYLQCFLLYRCTVLRL